MKIITLLLTLIMLCCSCSGGYSARAQGSEADHEKEQADFTVVNWNLQTFFDANKDGCEYKEYQKSEDWNQEKYSARLERLCQFISQRNADIYIFEEIENENVIYDISNYLTAGGHNWNQKSFWNYSVFSKEEGSAIGIGILSRHPLEDVKTHSMDIRIHKTKQPSVRPLLEVKASVSGRTLIILANHWKSKSGGEAKTEIWRDWQETVLANRLLELKNANNGSLPPVLIAGDFNRDAADFIYNLATKSSYLSDKKNTFLRSACFGYTDSIDINSLWFTQTGEFKIKTGSYYYDDKWEHIDNLMIAGNLKCTAFTPLATEPWASADGYPVPYRIYTGNGWSDHLPLEARLVITAP